MRDEQLHGTVNFVSESDISVFSNLRDRSYSFFSSKTCSIVKSVDLVVIEDGIMFVSVMNACKVCVNPYH